MVLVLTDWMEGSEVQGFLFCLCLFFWFLFLIIFLGGGVADLRVIGTWK